MFVFICLKTSTLSAHFGTLYTANAEARSEFREEKDQIYSHVLNSERKKITVDTRLLFFLSSSLCQSAKHILVCYLELCFFKLEDNCCKALHWLKIWNTSGICLSTLGRGCANLLCIVPIFSVCAAEASTRIVLFLMF